MSKDKDRKTKSGKKEAQKTLKEKRAIKVEKKNIKPSE